MKRLHEVLPYTIRMPSITPSVNRLVIIASGVKNWPLGSLWKRGFAVAEELVLPAEHRLHLCYSSAAVEASFSFVSAIPQAQPMCFALA
jgi:hypothetical protein